MRQWSARSRQQRARRFARDAFFDHVFTELTPRLEKQRSAFASHISAEDAR